MSATTIARDAFTFVQPTNPLAIGFVGTQPDAGLLPFDGSTVLCLSDAKSQAVVLEIAARPDALVLSLISSLGEQKIALPWRVPTPSIVAPCWTCANDRNGYEITVPELTVTVGEYTWSQGGIKYSVLVSQQSGSSLPKIKPRREGPQFNPQ